MLSKTLFVKSKHSMTVCAAWQVSMDENKIALMTGLSLKFIRRELERLWMAGVLLPDGKLDFEVEKYIHSKTRQKMYPKMSMTEDDDEPRGSSPDSGN